MQGLVRFVRLRAVGSQSLSCSPDLSSKSHKPNKGRLFPFASLPRARSCDYLQPSTKYTWSHNLFHQATTPQTRARRGGVGEHENLAGKRYRTTTASGTVMGQLAMISISDNTQRFSNCQRDRVEHFRLLRFRLLGQLALSLRKCDQPDRRVGGSVWHKGGCLFRRSLSPTPFSVRRCGFRALPWLIPPRRSSGTS